MSNIVKRNGDYIINQLTNVSDMFTPIDVILDRMFRKAFPTLTNELGNNFFESASYPKVDIIETDLEYIIKADIHGLNKDQVSVTLKDETLTIRGEKRCEDVNVNEDTKYHLKEIKRSSFSRSFYISDDILDKKSITAKFEDGILTIKLKKLKQRSPPIPSITEIKIE
jgi:HSP20 family protein